MRLLRSAAIIVAALSPLLAAAPTSAAVRPVINDVTPGPCNGNGGVEFVKCGTVNGVRVCQIYCDNG